MMLLIAALVAVTVPVAASRPQLQPPVVDPSWSSAATFSLDWDIAHRRKAMQPTTVRVLGDGRYLYIRFDAAQQAPVAVTQRSDDTVVGGSIASNQNISWSNDDDVWVDLWPTGPGGFEYQFEANAVGAHNESSTENASFAPHWESHGGTTDHGFSITMAIPLSVIHGAHSGTWRAQFIRFERATGAVDVWSYDAAQTLPDDAQRAGDLDVTMAEIRQAKPASRVALYGLGALASASAGGSTSRVGADLSIPVAPTAAFFSTLHPDYSNVELDQQTIAPTVTQRVFSEVRPFFTQGASYYNPFWTAIGIGQLMTLYTPNIPTPSQGYAFEGKQGQFGLAGFDAVSAGRSDIATALDYTSDDAHWTAEDQRIDVDYPGGVDDTNQIGTDWRSGKYLSGEANYSVESGTAEVGSNQNTAFDSALDWTNQDFITSLGVRKIGADFDPLDGYVAHSGIAGWSLYSDKVWNFAPQDALQALQFGGELDRYQGPQFGLAQSDNSIGIDALTKSAWDIQLFTGSDFWQFGQDLEPVTQLAGFWLTYHDGLANNLQNWGTHGGSSTPTVLALLTGHYGMGYMNTWFRTSSIRVGDRGSLSLVADDTAQYFHSGTDNIQWFDSASYAYQIGPNSSLALGVRRVVGLPPQPNGGGDCNGARTESGALAAPLEPCSNVSIAYHLRLANEEFYAAYGDPNALSTTPQALLKVTLYLGAQKGT